MSDAPLRLVTLGAAELQRPDGPGDPLPLLAPGKPLALLIYLAHAPGRSATRDELLDVLWAHVEPDKARATLRQTLYGLRNLLGETTLVVEGRCVRLADTVHVDTDDFWNAVRAGDVARVVAAYGGRFLPDVGLPGGEGFEQWADSERARLDRAYLRAAESLVRQHLDRGHAREALRLARALRNAYPLRQSIWRLLLEALDAAGEILSLRLEVDALQRMLETERLIPEPATVACLRALRTGSDRASAPESTTLTAELVGREREFSTLVTLWESSRTGIPRHAHVVAPAGLGKTRLITDVALRLRSLGGQVVIVRGHPGERTIRYALAADLAEALGALPGALAVSQGAAQALVSLAPSLSSTFSVVAATATADDVLRQRVLALSELVSAVSDEQPLAVLVDDLHWSDPESLQVISGLANRLRGRSLLVTASRPTEREIADDARIVQMTLEPLSRASVQEMLESVGVRLDPEDMAAVVDALHEASQGSPFLILQSLELAHDRGLLHRDDLGLTCPDVRALIRHVRLGDALAARIESLADDDRAVLSALAVGEMPLTLSVVAATIGQSAESVETHLVALASRGIVTANGLAWEPAHDTIARTAQRLLSPENRRRVCHALGRALASSASSAGQYRTAARMLSEGEATADLVSLSRQWTRVRRGEGDPRPTIDLVADLLGITDRRDKQVRALVGMLPLRERLSPRAWRAFSLAPVAAAFVVAALVFRDRPAAQLHVAVAPLSSGKTLDGKMYVFEPTPVIERRDDRGRLLDIPDESVTVRIASGSGRLVGPTRVPLVKGRGIFRNTGLFASGPIVLEFSTTKGDASVKVPFGDGQRLAERLLELMSVQLNGVSLDPRSPDLHVRPGEVVTGFVRVEYTTTFEQSTVWFGATPTWGDPATSYTSFGGLSTPTTRRGRTEEISFTAPETPGRYYYLIAWAPEPSAQFVFSATNWTMGTPRWHDGNDLASTPADSIEKAMRTGWLQTRVYKDLGGVRGYYVDEVGATAIRVIVDSVPGYTRPAQSSRSASGERRSRN